MPMSPARDLRTVALATTRLSLRSFTPADAAESFAASTPTLTRFMRWDPSPSPAAFAAIVAWASRELQAAGFTYPVAVANRSSRRLAESLGGTLVGTRELRKAGGVVLEEVVYRIPPPTRT